MKKCLFIIQMFCINTSLTSHQSSSVITEITNSLLTQLNPVLYASVTSVLAVDCYSYCNKQSAVVVVVVY